MSHLDLPHWERIVLDEEMDVIGPLATPRLLEFGVTFPATCHRDIPMLELTRGGSLLDGEGGDDILGDELHRVAPIRRLLRGGRPTRRRLRAAGAALAPTHRRARRFRIDSDVVSWRRPCEERKT